VLINIVGNAIKFTDAGTVLVTGAICENDGGPRLQLIIQDTGLGMSADTLSHLFEEFRQGDPSIDRRFGGTGLGLAICKKIVLALGGTIEATSELGKGSCFTIIVPCEMATTAGTPALDSASVTAKRLPRRVLVVEDNVVNRQVALGLLSNMGVAAEAVNNGAEAVSALSRDDHRYDAVLMDMQMPVLDGLSATRRLREMGVRTPVIGLTANAFSSDRQQCLDAGMADFVAKPVTRAKLSDAFARLALGASASGEAASGQREAMVEEFGQEAFDALVEAMVEDGYELLERAQQCDGQTVVGALHSLKGMARTLGFHRLGESAEEAEHAARRGVNVDLDAIRTLLTALDARPAPVAQSASNHA
jgi:CheY-like chemotaxis protein